MELYDEEGLRRKAVREVLAPWTVVEVFAAYKAQCQPAEWLHEVYPRIYGVADDSSILLVRPDQVEDIAVELLPDHARTYLFSDAMRPEHQWAREVLERRERLQA